MLVHTSDAVAPFFENGFIVACERTKEAVVIDPGDAVESLLAFAEQQALRIKYILLTHAHVDHVTGVPRAKQVFGVPVYLHRDDLFLYERAVEQGIMFGLAVSPLPPVDVFYEPGHVLTFGDGLVRAHHTPGHCPGGVCLEIGEQDGESVELFVGDTLFAGSIGRTDLPGGDDATLMRSIREVLFAFGDATVVHPGHGRDTTIGLERRTNPFLADRSLGTGQTS